MKVSACHIWCFRNVQKDHWRQLLPPQMHCVLPLVCIPVHMCKNVHEATYCTKSTTVTTPSASPANWCLGHGACWWLSSVLSSMYTPVLSLVSVYTPTIWTRDALAAGGEHCYVGRKHIFHWLSQRGCICFGKKHLCTKSGDLANTPNLFTHPQSRYNVHPPTVMVQCSPTFMALYCNGKALIINGTMYCNGKVLIIICSPTKARATVKYFFPACASI